MAPPSAVSFTMTTSWLTIAGSMAVTACGSSTDSMIWFLRMPSALAASAWPFGRVSIPARTISARTEKLYSTSPVTTAYSGRTSVSMVVYSAYTAFAVIIRISTGTARKSSTTKPAGIRTQRWSESLPMPNRAPSGSAMIRAKNAALSVFWRPGQMYVCHGWGLVKKGFHLIQSSWPFSARPSYTHHTTAAAHSTNSTV